MNKTKSLLLLLPVLALISVFGMRLGSAEENRRGGHPAEPRARGDIQHGMEHHIKAPGGPVVHAQVFHDHRSAGEVRRDPHVVAFNHVGWHPTGHWDQWHRDWGVFWRITDWNAIRTVTCEAVNTQTGLLYPVTEARADSWYWNSGLVDNVAARSLDECSAESGDPTVCSLVQGECWNSIY